MGGFEIALGCQLAHVASVGRDSLDDVGKFLAQEILPLDRTSAVHMDAENDRLVAGNEEQLTVFVARRPVKEFGKIHRNLRNPRLGMAAVPRCRRPGRPQRRED